MKIAADLHIHTISSGHAYSTLEEYIAQAKKIGLKAIAITDHASTMPGGPHQYHFSNMRMIPKEIRGIRVYRGVEANIINNGGEIDYAEDDFTDLDIVMAALHPVPGCYSNQGKKINTEVLLKTLANPLVNVLAHPGNPKYPIKVEETVAAAKANGVLIEINNSSPFSRAGSRDKCVEFAKEVKRQDWQVILGTDSHISTMLGVFEDALKIVKEAGLAEKHVVNTSLAKIDKWLKR